jgi:hypothetical protein
MGRRHSLPVARSSSLRPSSQAAPMQRRRCRRRPLGTRPPRRMTRSARTAKISSRHRPASSSTARSVLTAGANSTQKKSRTSTQPMIDADLGRGIVFNAATSSRIYFSRMRGRQRQRQSRMPIATPLPMRAGCSCIMASSAGGRACPGRRGSYSRCPLPGPRHHAAFFPAAGPLFYGRD